MSDHLSSSDEDMEELLELIEVPKTNAYFEEVVPQFSDEQYIEHFRLTREMTEELANRYANSDYYKWQEGDSEKVTPRYSMLGDLPNSRTVQKNKIANQFIIRYAPYDNSVLVLDWFRIDSKRDPRTKLITNISEVLNGNCAMVCPYLGNPDVAIGGYVEQIFCGVDHTVAICKPFI